MLSQKQKSFTMELKSKIALVTGGGRGLGKDMVLNLAKKGGDIVLTYNSKKDEALAVVGEVEKMGRKAAALQLNTGNVGSFKVFFDQLKGVLRDHFGVDKFDFLVNNGGNSFNSSIADATEQQFDDVVNVHFKGVFFLTQGSLPLINDGGRIINISSGLARFCSPNRSVYGAAKAAIETLSRYMAYELGKRGIAVNTVAPGAIATDFSGGIVRDNPEVNKHVASLIALGRVGLPEDIGPVVAFLCSDEARWINGQRIEVSGGQNI